MMNFRPTTEIDLAGKNFVITHWSPSKVMKNLPKIGRYIAVPMATISGALFTGGSNLSEALPTAILYLFDQMEQDDIEKLFELILEDVSVNGMAGKIDIDTVFQDKMLDLIKLVAEVLKINYGCFFTKDGFADLQGLLGNFGMVHQVATVDQEPTEVAAE